MQRCRLVNISGGLHGLLWKANDRGTVGLSANARMKRKTENEYILEGIGYRITRLLSLAEAILLFFKLPIYRSLSATQQMPLKIVSEINIH
jgi:hypothetical protein